MEEKEEDHEHVPSHHRNILLLLQPKLPEHPSTRPPLLPQRTHVAPCRTVKLSSRWKSCWHYFPNGQSLPLQSNTRELPDGKESPRTDILWGCPGL